MMSPEPDLPAPADQTAPRGPAPFGLTVMTLPAPGGHPGRDTARGAAARRALQACLEAWGGPLGLAGSVIGPRAEIGPDAVLVLAPLPVEMVARALEEGLDPEAALAAWREMAADLAELLDRRRNTILLAWETVALHDPACVLDAVAARLGLEAARPAPAMAPQEPPPGPAARHLVQAELCLARQSGAEADRDPLAARWLDLPDHAQRPLRARLTSGALIERIAEEAREAGLEAMRDLLHRTEEGWLDRETRRIEAHAAELAREQAAQQIETERHLTEILRLSQEAEHYRGLSETMERTEGSVLAGLRKEADELRGALKTAREELRQARTQAANLERKARANIDELVERLEAAQARARAATEDRTRLERSARTRSADLQSRIETLQAQLAEDRARSRDQAAESRKLARRLEEDLGRSKAEADRLAQQQGELEALRGELEAVRRSTSWRMTRPLRRVGALLRRRPAP